MIAQSCPKCHTEQDVSAHRHGDRLRCTNCQHIFRIQFLRALPPPAAVDGNLALAYHGPTEVGLPQMIPVDEGIGGEAPPFGGEIAPPQQLFGRAVRTRPAPNREQMRRPSFTIDGYELLDCLGRGGMGQVYRAIQLSLGREVAIKTLDTQLARNQASVMRFTKEAAAMARLHHPHIVHVIDRGANRHRHYFVMEYIDGPSLRELMQEGPFPPHEALKIMLALAKTMSYAHEMGVVHRDLKPENLLFTAKGDLKVADFGLAGVNEETTHIRKLTKSFVSMGTECYMAPEQRRNAKHVDHRADLYSLGVILFEMVTGQLPFPRLPGPETIIIPENPKIDQIIRRCLATHPDKRFDNTQAFCKSLEEALTVSAQHAAPRDTVVDHMAASALPQETEEKKGSLLQRLSLWSQRPLAAFSAPQPVAADPASPAQEDEEMWDARRFRHLVLTSLVLLVLALAVGSFFVFFKPPHLRTASGGAVMIPWEKQFAQVTKLSSGLDQLSFDLKARPLTDAWGGFPRPKWKLQGSWAAIGQHLEQDTYAQGMNRNTDVRWAIYKGHQMAMHDLAFQAHASFYPPIVKTREGERISLDTYKRKIQRSLAGKAKAQQEIPRQPTLGIGLRGEEGGELSLRLRPLQGRWAYLLRYLPKHVKSTEEAEPKPLSLPFRTRQMMHLKLTVQQNKVTAWINNQAVEKLDIPLQEHFPAHAGFLCRDAHCHFQEIAIHAQTQKREEQR